MADEKNREPLIPRSTDEENPPLNTAPAESPRKQADPGRKEKVDEPDVDTVDPLHGGNPPRTTTGKFTAPKFGSAGSGGAEFEPGPERD